MAAKVLGCLTRSRILTRAKRKVLELDGHAVSPQSGNPHRYTLIYLHGLGGCGADYLHADSELCWPWRLGPSYAPGLRAVFPSAPLQQQPWGETLPSWYQYQGIASNELAMPEQLAAVQEALDEVIRQEIERLEAPGCVFLGGVSQGCNVALDAYLRHDLGGFAGSVGFLPGDSWGFEGADRRLRTLLQKEQQAARPVWLQAAEEDTEVPYKLVQQSLERAHHWPGFTLRTLQGLGHDIGQHEATLLNDFLKAHAQDAYFEVDMNDAFDEWDDLELDIDVGPSIPGINA